MKNEYINLILSEGRSNEKYVSINKLLFYWSLKCFFFENLCIYTHKGWDYRDDYTELYCLLMVPCGYKVTSLNRSLINYKISHWKSIWQGRRLNLILKSSYFKGFRSSLQSRFLWVTLYVMKCANLNYWNTGYFKFKLLICIHQKCMK